MAIPQTGAAVLVVNEDGEILLLKKANGNKWVIPGGVQELGEDFEEVALRELFEETGIKYPKENLILIGVVTGEGRHKVYPNGDEVYNNTVLYLANNVKVNSVDISSEDYQDNGDGEYRLVQESTDYSWFSKDNLPRDETVHDLDLIKTYVKYLDRKNHQ